ncbi:helicase RepA family protein [Roseovarius sp.]|uniref:helicase RepA family protein n=1 Tax=Roseovarius sp. TaxID=1486281 RepID=UPI003B5C4F62
MSKFELLKEAFPSRDIIESNEPTMESCLSRGRKAPLDREKAIKDIKAGKDWHNNVRDLIASMVFAGDSDENILNLAPELTLRSYSQEETISDMQIMIDGARKKNFGHPVRVNPDWPTVFEGFNELTIPRRRWIYGSTYLRGYVSLLAAPGGVGKTSLQIVEALAIVTGQSLLGEEVKEKTNVWLINLEDAFEELQRRILAAMNFYEISENEVKNRLFVDADRDFSFQFVSDDKGEVSVNHSLIEAMVSKIKKHRIGLVILDPFVGCFNVNENDNRAINMVVSAIRKIADETDAAIAVVHHMRKLNGEDASVDGVRGASSIIGAVRVARVVNRISAKEAGEHFIDENQAKSVFRVDNAKMNFAPPADDTFWYKLDSSTLKNGEDVGVARRFDINSAVEDVADDTLNQIYSALQKAEQVLRQNEKSGSWIGNVVANSLCIDIGASKAKKERTTEQERSRMVVRSYIKLMCRRGWLATTEAQDTRNGRSVKVFELEREEN